MAKRRPTIAQEIDVERSAAEFLIGEPPKPAFDLWFEFDLAPRVYIIHGMRRKVEPPLFRALVHYEA